MDASNGFPIANFYSKLQQWIRFHFTGKNKSIVNQSNAKKFYFQLCSHKKKKRFLRSAAASTAFTAKKEEEKEKRFPNYLWWVPISMTDANHRDFSENNTEPVLWLTPKKISIKRRLLTEANQWIIANIRATGYYRVNYDQQNWQLLQQQLKMDHRIIDPINRAHLIDDAFALAAIKTLPYTLPFDLIRYLQNEQHYVPWSSALRSLSYIGRMFSFTKNHGRYKVTINYLKPIFMCKYVIFFV